MTKFDWNAFKGSANIAVYCKTEEEAKQFCKLMHEHGMTWRNEETYLNNTSWGTFKERTYYNGNGAYGEIDWINNHVGYTLLSFDLLDFEELPF